MAYAEIITLVRQVGRPVVISFMHDRFYASRNYYDDSSSDDEMPDGPCHWHGRCRKPCMNMFPMELYTKAGYVFRAENVYATPDLRSNAIWFFARGGN